MAAVLMLAGAGEVLAGPGMIQCSCCADSCNCSPGVVCQQATSPFLFLNAFSFPYPVFSRLLFWEYGTVFFFEFRNDIFHPPRT